MPRRPFYPVAPPPDIFGLLRPGLLSLESEAETRKRIGTVEKGVEAAFKAAIEHLGEEATLRPRFAPPQAGPRQAARA